MSSNKLVREAGLEHMKRGLTRSLVWWTVYAAAFGYVEALVVVYIRRIAGMGSRFDYAQIWAMHGLILSQASIALRMEQIGLWDTEITREIATIVLLSGAAWAAGRTFRIRCAILLYTFGVWDLTYYIWLRLWTGFPQTLSSTDVYYLIPFAWYGPVWFPVLIVMPILITMALWLLYTERDDSESRSSV